jgi:hypothetical protein
MDIFGLDHNSLGLIADQLNYEDGVNFALTNKELCDILQEQINDKVNLPRIEKDCELVTHENLIEFDTPDYKKIYNKVKGFTIIFTDQFMKKIDKLCEQENTDKYRRNKVIKIIKEINTIFLDDKGNLYYRLYDVELFCLIKTNVKNFKADRDWFQMLDLYILDNNDYIYHSKIIQRERLFQNQPELILNGKNFKNLNIKLFYNCLLIIDKINKKIYYYDNNEFDGQKLSRFKLFKYNKIEDYLYEIKIETFDDKLVSYLDKFKCDYHLNNFIFIYDNKLHMSFNDQREYFPFDCIDFEIISDCYNSEDLLIICRDHNNTYLINFYQRTNLIIDPIVEVEKMLIDKYKIDRFDLKFLKYHILQKNKSNMFEHIV